MLKNNWPCHGWRYLPEDECGTSWMLQFFFCSNSNKKHGKVGKDKSYTWCPLAVVWFQRHLYEKHKQTTNMKINVKTKKKHKLNHWTKKCATDKHKHRKKVQARKLGKKNWYMQMRVCFVLLIMSYIRMVVTWNTSKLSHFLYISRP